MAKNAISVTLDADNVLWLKGQAASGRTRGVSDTLNRIVTVARTGGHVEAGAARSVAGTIEAHPDDPNLDHADAYIYGLFDASMKRPVVARETSPPYGPPGKAGRKRG